MKEREPMRHVKTEDNIPAGLTHPKFAKTYEELRASFVGSLVTHSGQIDKPLNKEGFIDGVRGAEPAYLPHIERTLQELEVQITEYLRYLILASARAKELGGQAFLSAQKLRDLEELEMQIKETARYHAGTHKETADALVLVRKILKENSPFAWN